MTDPNSSPAADPHIELAAEIVSAYVSNNSARPNEVVDLLKDLVIALKSLSTEEAPESDPVPAAATKAEIRKSISDDFLTSFEDGKKYKTLKRHLAGRGMSPEQYREKWGLAADYPMVAPAYAAKRSELAKSLGLGRKVEAQPSTTKKPRSQKAS